MTKYLRKANEIKDILNNILKIVYPDNPIVFYKVYDTNSNKKLASAYIEITPHGDMSFSPIAWSQYTIVIRIIESILINNGLPADRNHVRDIKILYENMLPFKDYSDDEIKLYFRMVS